MSNPSSSGPSGAHPKLFLMVRLLKVLAWALAILIALLKLGSSARAAPILSCIIW